MKSTYLVKKFLYPFLPVVIFLGLSKVSLAQASDKLQFNTAGHEMALPVKGYSSGLRDLHRAYHDMTYTVLAKEEAAYFKQWQNKIRQYPFDHFSQQAKVDYLLLEK